MTAYYMIEMLLINCYICMKGNQIIDQFWFDRLNELIIKSIIQSMV